MVHGVMNGMVMSFYKRHIVALICVLLAALTFAAFSQVLRCDFLNFDDDAYVTANPNIQAGITGESIKWAFTTTHQSFWMPLVWISLMLDQQAYGLNPMGYHLTNLLFHIANALLLFLALRRMTRSTWRSALVAAIFAIHPLHVESVAWVTERKDVLSTLFWMLTMGAYALYAEKPGWRRYGLIVLCFVLGLMAKPALVTIPFVLLLMDYWPLGRLRRTGKEAGGVRGILNPVSEKLLLLPLTLVASIVAYVVCAKGSAITSGTIPLPWRIENALVSYATYIVKTVWPTKLAAYYPHPMGTLPVWQIAGSCALLMTITVLAVVMRRTRPYIIMGWLWYLGTLLPMIGIVQLGGCAMADRFTYISMIGLLMAAIWSLPEPASAAMRQAMIAGFTTIVIVFSALTWIQVGYWKDSVSIFEQTCKVTRDNYKAQYNLAEGLDSQDRIEEAIPHYREAIRIEPKLAEAHSNLALDLSSMGDEDGAIRELREAVRLRPDFAAAHNNLAVRLFLKGQYAQAWSEVHLTQACGVEPAPDFIDALSQKMPDPGQ